MIQNSEHISEHLKNIVNNTISLAKEYLLGSASTAEDLEYDTVKNILEDIKQKWEERLSKETGFAIGAYSHGLFKLKSTDNNPHGFPGKRLPRIPGKRQFPTFLQGAAGANVMQIQKKHPSQIIQGKDTSENNIRDGNYDRLNNIRLNGPASIGNPGRLISPNLVGANGQPLNSFGHPTEINEFNNALDRKKEERNNKLTFGNTRMKENDEKYEGNFNINNAKGIDNKGRTQKSYGKNGYDYNDDDDDDGNEDTNDSLSNNNLKSRNNTNNAQDTDKNRSYQLGHDNLKEDITEQNNKLSADSSTDSYSEYNNNYSISSETSDLSSSISSSSNEYDVRDENNFMNGANNDKFPGNSNRDLTANTIEGDRRTSKKYNSKGGNDKNTTGGGARLSYGNRLNNRVLNTRTFMSIQNPGNRNGMISNLRGPNNKQMGDRHNTVESSNNQSLKSAGTNEVKRETNGNSYPDSSGGANIKQYDGDQSEESSSEGSDVIIYDSSSEEDEQEGGQDGMSYNGIKGGAGLVPVSNAKIFGKYSTFNHNKDINLTSCFVIIKTRTGEGIKTKISMISNLKIEAKALNE